MNTVKKKLTVKKGFTLIEMIIGIVIFVVLSLGVVALVSNVLVSSNTQSTLLANSDQARKVGTGLMNELRNAQVSSTGAYPLDTAGDQTLIFYSNIDGGSDMERVRYYVQNGKLYKGVIKASGNPLTYNPANETSAAVQDNLANGAGPLFYYYDGTYEGTSTQVSLVQPVSVTQVKFVKLDLKVYNKGGVANNNFYSVTASGSIRNLKDNLANQGFPDYVYTLATSTSPLGTGSIASSPAGSQHNEFSIVNLTAYANLGYGFSSWTGNVTNSTSSATTIIMNKNETVTANFVALPQTLVGSISSKAGPTPGGVNRRWTLRVDNPNSYAVNSTNLYSFSLTQTAGPACAPVLTIPAAFPAVLSGSGNIAAGGNRTIQVTINFTGCNNATRFTANFSFAGNGGANWGSASITNQPQ